MSGERRADGTTGAIAGTGATATMTTRSLFGEMTRGLGVDDASF
jgi:hypothetical protein